MDKSINELQLIKDNLQLDIDRLNKERKQLIIDHELLLGNINSIIPNLKHDDFAIIPKSEIIKCAKSFRRIKGVYFLIKDNEIVYIGRSINVLARIMAHPKDWYDKASFIECSNIVMLEALYIHMYQPIHNARVGNDNHMATNVSINTLIEKCKQDINSIDL